MHHAFPSRLSSDSSMAVVEAPSVTVPRQRQQRQRLEAVRDQPARHIGQQRPADAEALEVGVDIQGVDLGHRLVAADRLGDRAAAEAAVAEADHRSEEHTSELQSLMRISYADLCLKIKKKKR